MANESAMTSDAKLIASALVKHQRAMKETGACHL